MSTQLHFDLAGLCRAITTGDVAYELALYAEAAEVWVTDLDTPSMASTIVVGRPAIAGWIGSRTAPTTSHSVVELESTPTAVAFVDACTEGFAPRTVRLHHWTAAIEGGQIVRASVAVRRATG